MRQFVEKMELDAETREVELELRLPGDYVKRMEAAARIALFGTVLPQRARVRLRCVGGRGRKEAAVEEIAGS